MRQSQLFTKTLKTMPKDEEAINAQLLIRGGFVRKLAAGVYTHLPLGWRVLHKINQIIREEMNAIGGQELLMPTLVPKEYWEKSKRWDTEVMYKLSVSNEKERASAENFGLGWTHEEVITYLATHFINSYKDLPLAVYQIQTKFRNEPRAKSGLLRGREFMMKDLYSFHTTKEDLDGYYETIIAAYKKIFSRLALKPRLTEAGGGAFTKEYTHEFQVLAPAGEDTIFYCSQCDFSQNKEIVQLKEGDRCPKCGDIILVSPGIEVANVFKLGTRYSDAFSLKFLDKNGKKQPVVMGSYGIGVTRLMGTLVEVFHDVNGIMWPEAVSPFDVHLLVIGGKQSSEIAKTANRIYNQLQKAGAEVLYDDRDASAGEKFSDADLLGVTWRAVISEKTLPRIELRRRDTPETKMISVKEFIKKFSIYD